MNLKMTFMTDHVREQPLKNFTQALKQKNDLRMAYDMLLIIYSQCYISYDM